MKRVQQTLKGYARAVARNLFTSISFHELIIAFYLFGLKPGEIFHHLTPGLKARVSNQSATKFYIRAFGSCLIVIWNLFYCHLEFKN